MKNALLLTWLLAAWACSQPKTSGSGVYEGKLVISAICSHYVVQITGGGTDTSRTVSGWYDESRRQRYDHVFTVANRCAFAEAGLKEGDRFRFRFTSKKEESCMVCEAYYPTPPKQQHIEIIR